MMFVSTTGIVISGALIGVLTMLLYARLSPQQRVTQLSVEIAQARAALSRAGDDDMRLMWAMVRRAVGLSLEQIKLVLLPTCCAAIVALGLAWMADLVFDISEFSLAPGREPSWLFSGYAAFWIPLTVVALAVRWKYGIK